MNSLSASQSRPSSPGIPWFGVACAVAATLIWGVQAVVSRQSVADGLSAGDVTILRFGAAALVLLPYALRRMRPFPVGKMGWRRAIVLTALIGPIYSLLLVGGAHFAPALHSAIITPSLIPVFTAALVFVAFGERAGFARLAGLALIVGGVLLFSLEALMGAPLREGAWIGDAFFALMAVQWALFGVLSRRWNVGPVEVTIATCLLSIPLLPAVALTIPSTLADVPFGAAALQAVYQGLLVGVLALFFYSRANAVLGAARAALFMPLVPVFAALSGALLLGEVPTPTEIAGMGVVLCGMTLALRAPAFRPR